MRIIAILGSLIVGLVGLLMSVCGGGLLFSLGHDTVRNILDHRDPNGLRGLFVLLIPAGALLLGIVVCWSAYQAIRRNLRDDDE